MRKSEREKLTHVTPKEFSIAQILHLVLYLGIVLPISMMTNTPHFLLFIGFCIFILIATQRVIDTLLRWTNERRCEGEPDPKDSSGDSDSD